MLNVDLPDSLSTVNYFVNKLIFKKLKFIQTYTFGPNLHFIPTINQLMLKIQQSSDGKFTLSGSTVKKIFGIILLHIFLLPPPVYYTFLMPNPCEGL